MQSRIEQKNPERDQFSSVTQSCLTLCVPMNCSIARLPCPSPAPRVYSDSCPLNRWCHPTISSFVIPFSSCLQSFPASRSFQMSQLFTSKYLWPKYWSFSFNISPSNEHSGLISFRMDWLDLVAVQGTLKSLLQHHSSKASILRHSAFFIVQLSHPYMTTGKTIALSKLALFFLMPSPCQQWMGTFIGLPQIFTLRERLLPSQWKQIELKDWLSQAPNKDTSPWHHHTSPPSVTLTVISLA